MSPWNEDKYTYYRKYVRASDTDALERSCDDWATSDEYKQACIDEIVERGGTNVYYYKTRNYRPVQETPSGGSHDKDAPCYCERLFFNQGHQSGCPHKRTSK